LQTLIGASISTTTFNLKIKTKTNKQLNQNMSVNTSEIIDSSDDVSSLD